MIQALGIIEPTVAAVSKLLCRQIEPWFHSCVGPKSSGPVPLWNINPICVHDVGARDSISSSEPCLQYLLIRNTTKETKYMCCSYLWPRCIFFLGILKQGMYKKVHYLSFISTPNNCKTYSISYISAASMQIVHLYLSILRDITLFSPLKIAKHESTCMK